MVIEYNRPVTLEAALSLLARRDVRTLPLGGGTILNQPSGFLYAVVDLQSLGLDTIQARGNTLTLGACVTLQKLLEIPVLPETLKMVVRQEASYNLRQVATLAGTLVSADGRSPVAAALLALDATLEIKSASGSAEQVSLGELLPVRGERLAGRLITSVALPLKTRLAYEYVARTPVDLPIVCVALAHWPSGRTRLVLGGYGDAPILALDGPEPGGVEIAARDAYSQAGDEWASAEYRQNVAGLLAGRCLAIITG